MIHAHHFYFADQPTLQEEYEAFGFQHKEGNAETIVIQELEKHKGFEQRTSIRYLSGRQCTYLSNTNFDSLGERESWGLEINNVLTLVWDSELRNIYYGKSKYFTPELLRFWIFHTFFPIVLELERDYKILHVGAVEIKGEPVFFSADSFGGKSTLTNYFIQKGHALFSDDTLPVRRVDESYIAYPSFPYHRPYRKVESLGVPVKNFARNPAPIKTIFELKRAAPDAEVEITQSMGVEKFKTLYYSHFIKFSFMKHERFALAMEMTKYVPVYKITVPWDLDRLEEVYKMICDHTAIR